MAPHDILYNIFNIYGCISRITNAMINLLFLMTWKWTFKMAGNSKYHLHYSKYY